MAFEAEANLCRAIILLWPLKQRQISVVPLYCYEPGSRFTWPSPRAIILLWPLKQREISFVPLYCYEPGFRFTWPSPKTPPPPLSCLWVRGTEDLIYAGSSCTNLSLEKRYFQAGSKAILKIYRILLIVFRIYVKWLQIKTSWMSLSGDISQYIACAAM